MALSNGGHLFSLEGCCAAKIPMTFYYSRNVTPDNFDNSSEPAYSLIEQPNILSPLTEYAMFTDTRIDDKSVLQNGMVISALVPKIIDIYTIDGDSCIGNVTVQLMGAIYDNDQLKQLVDLAKIDVPVFANQSTLPKLIDWFNEVHAVCVREGLDALINNPNAVDHIVDANKMIS